VRNDVFTKVLPLLVLSGKPKIVLKVIVAVLWLTGCATATTPPGSTPSESGIMDIDGAWRASAVSDTGRRWSSTIRISSGKFNGTISCEPFPDIRVSGHVGDNRAVYFLINKGRRDIPAMGQYSATGNFPSLNVRHHGGRCGNAVLQFAR
jgi:hypothetical protein